MRRWGPFRQRIDCADWPIDPNERIQDCQHSPASLPRVTRRQARIGPRTITHNISQLVMYVSFATRSGSARSRRIASAFSLVPSRVDDLAVDDGMVNSRLQDTVVGAIEQVV